VDNKQIFLPKFNTTTLATTHLRSESSNFVDSNITAYGLKKKIKNK
jgi:hypothetical protein